LAEFPKAILNWKLGFDNITDSKTREQTLAYQLDFDASFSDVFGVAMGVDVMTSSSGDSSITALWFSVPGSFAACIDKNHPHKINTSCLFS
jgi:hypothetical protein